MPCELMDSEPVAQLGQVRVTSFFQAITLHFSIPVQRRNHCCRSGEPKPLLAAKFYSWLPSLHHAESDTLTPPCCFSPKWGQQLILVLGGLGHHQASHWSRPLADFTHFHWCLHQVPRCHLPLLKLPTSISQLRHFHLLQCLTGTNASVYIAGALLGEEYTEP